MWQGQYYNRVNSVPSGCCVRCRCCGGIFVPYQERRPTSGDKFQETLEICSCDADVYDDNLENQTFLQCEYKVAEWQSELKNWQRQVNKWQRLVNGWQHQINVWNREIRILQTRRDMKRLIKNKESEESARDDSQDSDELERNTVSVEIDSGVNDCDNASRLNKH